MREWCEALAQEPWCFHPDQIGRLTDGQIVELYLKPAMRRAEEFRKSQPAVPPAPGGPGGPGGPAAIPPPAAPPAGVPQGPEGEPGSDIHRRQVIDMGFVGTMGMSRQRAEALYEKQLAEYHRMKAAGEL